MYIFNTKNFFVAQLLLKSIFINKNNSEIRTGIIIMTIQRLIHLSKLMVGGGNYRFHYTVKCTILSTSCAVKPSSRYNKPWKWFQLSNKRNGKKFIENRFTPAPLPVPLTAKITSQNTTLRRKGLVNPGNGF